jgi:hypothetical protein
VVQKFSSAKWRVACKFQSVCPRGVEVAGPSGVPQGPVRLMLDSPCDAMAA